MNIQLVQQTELLPGALYRKYLLHADRGDTHYHVLELDMDKVDDFFVTPFTGNRTYVPDWLKKYGYHFGINADGWTHDDAGQLVMAGYNASQGKPYGIWGNEETLYISREKKFSLQKPTFANLWNAVSFSDTLVRNGIAEPNDKEDNDIRARSAFGYTEDQTLAFIVWVDGQDYFSHVGMSYDEMTELMLSLKCWFACMFDGGNSTTFASMINGVISILGIPNGEDKPLNPDGSLRYPGYNLRRVANCLQVKMKSSIIPDNPEVPLPDEGGTTMPVLIYRVLVPVRPRSIASMTTNDQGSNVPAGTSFTSSITQVDAITASHPIMVLVQSGPYIGKWLPLIYMGTEYVKADPISEPLPTPEIGKVTLNYALFDVYDTNGNLIGQFEMKTPVDLTPKLP